PGHAIDIVDLGLGSAGAGNDTPVADWVDALRRWAASELAGNRPALYARARDTLDRALIDVALQRTGGRRHQAARALGMGRNTLTRKLAATDPESPEDPPG